MHINLNSPCRPTQSQLTVYITLFLLLKDLEYNNNLFILEFFFLITFRLSCSLKGINDFMSANRCLKPIFMKK